MSTESLPTALNIPAALRLRRGRLGIGCQNRTERCLQRPEMRLVGPPFFRRLAIDRPAHLLRARSADGPLGLVEFEHLRLEVEAAKIEQPADLSLGVVH